DFTGYSLRRLTAPSGYIREVLEGCPMGPSEWEHLSWDADLPGKSHLQIRLRTANTLGALTSAPWIGPWDSEPIDLLASPGPLGEERLLEVEARLISNNMSSLPALHSITIRLHCPI
ncbi:MAG: hypothetical protein IIA67_07725, partial [Planctomycetes bacterium]|nr:hypothetical protein [Planctomycetota bacterium]